MSDSVRPQRRQPTRLPRPWDSPGKNTGVGCHFLLQCMKVKSEREVAQSCLTCSDPMDCSPPGSYILGIFPARIWEWVAFLSPGDCQVYLNLKFFLIKKGKENKNMFIGGKWEEVLVACINVFTLVCHSTKKRNVLCVKIKSSFLALWLYLKLKKFFVLYMSECKIIFPNIFSVLTYLSP